MDRTRKITIFFGVFWLFSTNISSAKTLNVCQSGCEFSKIQPAIDGSLSGDTVRVAKGVYAENISIDGKTNISVLGGYNDNTFSYRDPSSNLTTVDGKGVTNTIYISNSAKVTIDGFVIKNGQALDGAGVKIVSNSINNKSEVVLLNNTISDNIATYGGGIAIISNNTSLNYLNLVNNKIVNNHATYGGGIAVNAEHASYVEIISSNNTVNNNEAEYYNFNSFGGGIYLNPVGVGSTIKMKANNDSISYNKAGGDGGGIVVNNYDKADTILELNDVDVSNNTSGFAGGGIYFVGTTSTGSILKINNSRVVANKCNQGSPAGGGIYVSMAAFDLDLMDSNISNNGAGNGAGGGVAIKTSGESTINIKSNVISNNGGLSSGGGVYIENSNSLALTVSHNKITSNQISNNGSGGGVYLKNSGNLTGSFTNNVVAKNGSGYMFGGTNDSFNGGGIALFDTGITNLTFTNNTITDNYTNSAVYIESTSGSTKLDLANEIIFANMHNDIFNKLSAATINISYSNIGIIFGRYNDSGGNIMEQPLFDANSQDFRLTATSPCIDMGTLLGAPSIDIEGTSRPRGFGIDMGAYEYKNDAVVSVVITGTGTGMISSDPPILGCGTSCYQIFNLGDSITLHATPAEYSLFSDWSGACSGSGTCTVLMDNDKTVIATFNKDILHAVRWDFPAISYFQSLLEAYSLATSPVIIKAWGTEFSGDVTFSENKAIRIIGGYNSGYTANTGKTILRGVVKIQNGTVRVENLRVR